MTDASTQNPFAPPRAHVEDQYAAPRQVVTATRASRFLAFLIDCSPALVIGVVGGIVAAIMLPGLFAAGKFDPMAAGMMAFGLFFLVIFVATIAWLVWQIVLLYKYGQTIGKKAMGIRVVRMDGTRVAFSRFIFLRWLPVFVLGCIPFVGWIISSLLDPLLIFRESRQCLHDDFANTRVVTAASSTEATLRGDPKYAGTNLRTINF